MHDISRVVMHHSISRLCGHQPVARSGDFDLGLTADQESLVSLCSPGRWSRTYPGTHDFIEGNQGTDLYQATSRPAPRCRVPVGSQGTVQIDAVGLDLMGCKLATGSLTDRCPIISADSLSGRWFFVFIISYMPFAPAMNFQVAGGLSPWPWKFRQRYEA